MCRFWKRGRQKKAISDEFQPMAAWGTWKSFPGNLIYGDDIIVVVDVDVDADNARVFEKSQPMGAWGIWKGFQGNVDGDVDCDADCVVDGDLDGDVDVDGDVNFGVDFHVPVHVVDVDYIHAVHVFHKSQHFDCRWANIHRKKFLIITKTLLGKGWQ